MRRFERFRQSRAFLIVSLPRALHLLSQKAPGTALHRPVISHHSFEEIYSVSAAKAFAGVTMGGNESQPEQVQQTRTFLLLTN